MNKTRKLIAAGIVVLAASLFFVYTYFSAPKPRKAKNIPNDSAEENEETLGV